MAATDEPVHDLADFRFRYVGLLIRSGQQHGVSNGTRIGVIYLRFKPHPRIVIYFGIFPTFPAAAKLYFLWQFSFVLVIT